jgi:hypothetical protein
VNAFSDLDHDEQLARLVTFESVLDAAADRRPVVDTVLADLRNLSAGRTASSGGFAGFDDVEDASTELMMRIACYREAEVVIAKPVMGTLLAFLA